MRLLSLPPHAFPPSIDGDGVFVLVCWRVGLRVTRRRKEITTERKNAAEERRRLEEEKAKVRTEHVPPLLPALPYSCPVLVLEPVPPPTCS